MERKVGVGVSEAGRRYSSRGSTSGTTAGTSPRTWCCRRPRTGRTSRAGTSWGTR